MRGNSKEHWSVFQLSPGWSLGRGALSGHQHTEDAAAKDLGAVNRATLSFYPHDVEIICLRLALLLPPEVLLQQLWNGAEIKRNFCSFTAASTPIIVNECLPHKWGSYANGATSAPPSGYTPEVHVTVAAPATTRRASLPVPEISVIGDLKFGIGQYNWSAGGGKHRPGLTTFARKTRLKQPRYVWRIFRMFAVECSNIKNYKNI